MKKIINDTLKGPDGKWSRKSLTTLVSFLNAIATGWYIIVAESVNMHSISVFYGFLGLGGGALALTVIDKIRNNNI
tara:strand:+ start:38 stop:265 length:228 start_codon:yes stop_codon:yes gene_type:complete